VVICMERGADLHMAKLMPLSLTVSCFSKIRIDFTYFWYMVTHVVPERGPLNGYMSVQGSVATHLRCGGVVSNQIIAECASEFFFK